MQIYRTDTNYLILPAMSQVLLQMFMVLFAGLIIQFSLYLWVLRLLKAVDCRMMSKHFINIIINVFIQVGHVSTSECRTKSQYRDWQQLLSKGERVQIFGNNINKSILSLGIPFVYVKMKQSTMKVKTQLNLLARLQLWC